jgi:hypothetical protein
MSIFFTIYGDKMDSRNEKNSTLFITCLFSNSYEFDNYFISNWHGSGFLYLAYINSITKE